ncbi:hypothetical protein NDU88_002906 [Pleurodeles waltl]|uniref:Uncharacterized protein n=1 Tax=Pleurodeles waltl TaxID=8319 RepID=A0AAV7UWZ2_PLEWA|nr:hypothetical protein NDU88_002906 [Pleurodeles waltl]
MQRNSSRPSPSVILPRDRSPSRRLALASLEVRGAEQSWAACAGALSPDRGAAGVTAPERADLASPEVLQPEDRRPRSKAARKWSFFYFIVGRAFICDRKPRRTRRLQAVPVTAYELLPAFTWRLVFVDQKTRREFHTGGVQAGHALRVNLLEKYEKFTYRLDYRKKNLLRGTTIFQP